MKKTIILSLLTIIGLFTFLSSNAQQAKTPTIKWISLKEALELNKTAPKKIAIDLYTDWCGWCKRMDVTTFADSAVAAYMNQNFYAVKFNAETSDTVFYKNQILINQGVAFNKRATHDFALQVGSDNGRMGFPTITYLDENSNKAQAIPGYLTADQYLLCLKYINENHYKTKTFEEYYNAEMTKKANGQ